MGRQRAVIGGNAVHPQVREVWPRSQRDLGRGVPNVQRADCGIHRLKSLDRGPDSICAVDRLHAGFRISKSHDRDFRGGDFSRHRNFLASQGQKDFFSAGSAATGIASGRFANC